MSKLIRYHQGTDICFVTSVTYARNRILINNADIMDSAVSKYSRLMQYIVIAYVILPDHFHALIDCNGNDLSGIMRKVKLSFSKNFRNRFGLLKGHIWQRRFWDHIIRDQGDLNRSIDYIHINPVKHGLVESPFDWEYSTIHKYFREGYYNLEWGKQDIDIEGDFGE